MLIHIYLINIDCDKNKVNDQVFVLIKKEKYILKKIILKHRCPSRLKTDRCCTASVKKATPGGEKNRKPTAPLPRPKTTVPPSPWTSTIRSVFLHG